MDQARSLSPPLLSMIIPRPKLKSPAPSVSYSNNNHSESHLAHPPISLPPSDITRLPFPRQATSIAKPPSLASAKSSPLSRSLGQLPQPHFARPYLPPTRRPALTSTTIATTTTTTTTTINHGHRRRREAPQEHQVPARVPEEGRYEEV